MIEPANAEILLPLLPLLACPDMLFWEVLVQHSRLSWMSVVVLVKAS